MPSSYWEFFKVAAKKVWEIGKRYATPAILGYEAHELIDNIGEDNTPRPIYRPPQMYRQPVTPAEEDQMGAIEIIIILMAIIIFLLLITLLIFGGAKFISFIGKRAVKRYQEEQEEEE